MYQPNESWVQRLERYPTDPNIYEPNLLRYQAMDRLKALPIRKYALSRDGHLEGSSASEIETDLVVHSIPRAMERLAREVFEGYHRVWWFLSQPDQPEWLRSELKVAYANGGCLWSHLSREFRLDLWGTTIDHGVDVLDGQGGLYQVKDYNGHRVRYDAVAKLNQMAEVAEVRGLVTSRKIACHPGTELRRQDTPGLNLIEFIPIPEPPIIEPFRDPWEAEHLEKLQRLQRQILEAIRSRPNQTDHRICLPTGTGKSYIIKGITDLFPDLPILITAPRVEIVEQLRSLIRRQGVEIRTLQSAHHFNRQPFIFIQDEAHYGDERGQVRDILAKQPFKVFYLSATLDRPDPELSMTLKEAITKGLICRPEIWLRGYTAEPTPENLRDYLNEHPEARSVLVCHQRQDEARRFSAVLQSSDVYISDDQDRNQLERFRAGKLRVLHVVTMVEMGVNVERIETIIFLKPWASKKRTLQLIGRGTRWHPSKGSHFNVVLFQTYDEIESTAAFLLEAFDEFYNRPYDLRKLRIEPGDPEDDPIIETKADLVYVKLVRIFEDPKVRKRREYAEQKAFLASQGIHNSAYRMSLLERYPDIYRETTPEAYFKEIGFNFDDFLDRGRGLNQAAIRRKAERRHPGLSYEELRDRVVELRWNE